MGCEWSQMRKGPLFLPGTPLLSPYPSVLLPWPVSPRQSGSARIYICTLRAFIRSTLNTGVGCSRSWDCTEESGTVNALGTPSPAEEMAIVTSLRITTL